MKEAVLNLVKGMCRPGVEDSVLTTLCEAACSRLDGMLAEGVTAEDCAESYLPAAAWLVMDMLADTRNWEGITSLSAGDMTVRREGGGHSGRLEQRAMELMSPYMKDKRFVFQGVRG